MAVKSLHLFNSMKFNRYTLDQLKSAVVQSKSRRQVLDKLGLKPAGGNYATLNKAIKLYKLDVSHFIPPSLWNKGKKFGHKRNLQDYLSNKFPIISHRLRLRLLSEGIFSHQCNRCKLTEWLNNPIPLELEHKDGDHLNNNLDNLELLCPNCHTLTPTYRGKNISKN